MKLHCSDFGHVGRRKVFIGEGYNFVEEGSMGKEQMILNRVDGHRDCIHSLWCVRVCEDGMGWDMSQMASMTARLVQTKNAHGWATLPFVALGCA